MFITEILTCNKDQLEQLGSKEKFWFYKDNDFSEKYLFKFSRENTGEHWSEKICEQISSILEIPHATYTMSSFNQRIGIYCPSLVTNHERLVMGNEVLHAEDKTAYPEPDPHQEKKFVRTREHTFARILGCLDKQNISCPPNSPTPTASSLFCGYLLLDAIVGNQDRHHENWALILDTRTGARTLCPTYDHAASLAFNISDDKKNLILTTKDKGQDLAKFCSRARSAIYGSKTDPHPLGTVDLFTRAAIHQKNCKSFWLDRLEKITEDKISEILSKFDENTISHISKEFTLKYILQNKQRILNYGEN